MLIHDLQEKKLIHPPKFLADNTHYMCVMGSTAYGVSTDNSDQDIYGFCIPPKEQVFPHLTGEIQGFGRQVQRFEQWSEHHIMDGAYEYDFAIYSIVKYFHLCMENNPNMCDSLFVPKRCVKHVTKIGQHVLDNRTEFLHKGSFHKFRGYAFAQMAKIKGKQNSKNPKRQETIDKHGFDTKFAYHVVRLALEAEQILMHRHLDLEANSQELIAIRRGDWKLEDIEKWFTEKERALETLYATSTIPHSPDEDRLKQILVDCLEMHYGDLSSAITVVGKEERALRDIRNILDAAGV